MKYFAYGSNMNPERMRKRGVDFLIREHAILDGWRLVFNKVASRNFREGYANIERDETDTVEGVLYTLGEEDMEKLDVCEGYPCQYDRMTVRVRLDNGEEMQAVTYVAVPDIVKDGVKPSRKYLNHLLAGCDVLSAEYCARLRKWETMD
mgnify:CR=1 FL=1